MVLLFHSDIQSILDRHKVVFGDMPKGLPPNRRFQHIIELGKGTKLVMITPLRHQTCSKMK